MLIHEGDERTADIDVRLAASLSAIAGAINSAGFHAVGFFSANMTGNISALSDHLALGELALAALFALLVFAFIFGAFLSALLIEAGRRRGMRAIYAYSIAAEGVLLALLGLADLLLPGVHSSPLLILGLSFLMGVQNAATTRISNARVRTTHVSGMATDIGIGLAGLAGMPADGMGRQAIRSRLRLHVSTLLAFFAGGVGGVIVYQWIGGALLLLTALALCAIAVPEVRRARQPA